MIKFTKMHGLGNDYVYIDCINQDIYNEQNLAKFISNRNFGVGSDGLILIKESNVADFRMQMFNSDGTEAEMCGNGIRCIGKFIYEKGLSKKNILKIETLAGIKKLILNIKNEKVESVKVDMGEPILESKNIPVKGAKCFKSKDNISFYKLTLPVDKDIKELTCVSMGNPHAVEYVSDVNTIEIEKIGKTIEFDSHFPSRVNVEFIEIIDDENIKMRVWERGTGETLACGTGACASAVSSFLNGYTKRNVTVELLGGKLEIEWNKENNHVYMTGPAKTVFDGNLYINCDLKEEM